MATVNLAAVKNRAVLLGWSPVKTLVICGVLQHHLRDPAGLWASLGST